MARKYMVTIGENISKVLRLLHYC